MTERAIAKPEGLPPTFKSTMEDVDAAVKSHKTGGMPNREAATAIEHAVGDLARKLQDSLPFILYVSHHISSPDAQLVSIKYYPGTNDLLVISDQSEKPYKASHQQWIENGCNIVAAIEGVVSKNVQAS